MHPLSSTSLEPGKYPAQECRKVLSAHPTGYSMAPSFAETNGASVDESPNFETITITDFYSKEIRFPVRRLAKAANPKLTLDRPLCKMKDQMP